MAEVILIILLVLWLCMCWCFLIPCCQRCVCRECEVHHELGKKSPLDGVWGRVLFSMQLEFFLSLGGFYQTVIPSRHQQKLQVKFVNFKDI